MDEVAATPEPESVDIDAIIKGLQTDFHVLPEAAIRLAQRHREAVVPRLIEEIRQGIAAVKANEGAKHNGPFLSLFLLWEFKAKEAWPVIQEAYFLPREQSDALFGEESENLR